MMVKVLQTLIGLFCATALYWMGLGTGLWYDRRPPDYPQFHVHVLFFHWTWIAPQSLKAQLTTIKAAEAKATAHAKVVGAEQLQISASADTRERAAQAKIVYITRTLTKEIPVVITPQVDRNFPLPVGLVRLHDAAADGVDLSALPLPTGVTNDSPSPITASRFGSVIVTNYGECRADAERLTALQGWITAQQRAMNGP
jgi:hypothetical protein